MSYTIFNDDCLNILPTLESNSVDLVFLDLPYGITDCHWDKKIDLDALWKQLLRIRRNKRTPFIFTTNTAFGFDLIASNRKMFKMDLVWKKRNVMGALHAHARPMRNHEMIYFFYEQAPCYNRDKYHKRIGHMQIAKEMEGKKVGEDIYGQDIKENKPKNQGTRSFDPPCPKSVIEQTEHPKDIYGKDKFKKEDYPPYGGTFKPPNPKSVIDTDIYGESPEDRKKRGKGVFNEFEPKNPNSIFESTEVRMGKTKYHQTEKPQSLMEFLLKYWSNENDTILDPTMGSGSTGVACHTLNRNFIGIEMDEKIFKIAEDRLSNLYN